jgi:hypothetical protein
MMSGSAAEGPTARDPMTMDRSDAWAIDSFEIRGHLSRPPLSTAGTVRAFGYRGQVQSDPQAQLSPQRHPARRTFCVLWQPHVQAAPGQDAHEQDFEVVVLFDMTGSL